MLPPPLFPIIAAQSPLAPHINVPNQNNINIPGVTQRQAAYLIQAVVAPLPKFPDENISARR